MSAFSGMYEYTKYVVVLSSSWSNCGSEVIEIDSYEPKYEINPFISSTNNRYVSARHLIDEDKFIRQHNDLLLTDQTESNSFMLSHHPSLIDSDNESFQDSYEKSDEKEDDNSKSTKSNKLEPFGIKSGDI